MGIFNNHKKKDEPIEASNTKETEEDNQKDQNNDFEEAEAAEEAEVIEREINVSPADILLEPEKYGQYADIIEAKKDKEASSDTDKQTIEQQVNYIPIKTYEDKKPVDHTIGQTLIIAILNQKGGVGKSTTAINLAAALGEKGKQVLLVDLDPQGNTSSGLGIEKSLVKNCIYDTLLNDVPMEKIILPDIVKGVDVAPATINLAGAEVELVTEMARENRLKEATGAFRGKYDYIFIDCPPSLGLLTVNALVAADKLLIPIQCEFYALEGVTKLLNSMKRVKTRLNPALEIFGIVLTMYDGRTTLARQVAEEVRGFFGNKVFKTLIPRTVKLSEAPSFGIPITQYDPTGKGAASYIDLAEEVINRG